MKTNKQIETWAAKGAMWCAERLWKARNELSSRNHYQANRLADDVIEYEESKAMKRVLDANIVMPEKLIVTYIWYGDPECSWCEEGYVEDRDCETCEFHIPHEETRPMEFYYWTVSDGQLDAVIKQAAVSMDTHFKYSEFNCEVIRIVDAKTMTVLYEKEKNNDQ